MDTVILMALAFAIGFFVALRKYKYALADTHSKIESKFRSRGKEIDDLE